MELDAVGIRQVKLPSATSNNGQRRSVVERAALYLRKCPGAVSGEHGHDRLFFVACQLRHGFDLSESDAMSLLRKDYNPRCDPSWSEAELLHKCQDAGTVESHEKARGHLVGWKEGDRIEPFPTDDVPPWESPEPETNGQPKPTKNPLADGALILDDSMRRIFDREAEIVFDSGEALEGFEIGPGKVTVVGAPPGTGKTSLASQVGFAVLGNHDVPLVIANAEMDPGVLVRRELARSAQVSYQKLRFATFDDTEEGRLETAGRCLRPLMERTQFMEGPYTSEKLIGDLGDSPGLLIVDYLQKFRSGPEALEGLEVVMGHLRWIAHHGWAVLALSSTARQQGKGGKHDHSQLDMGAFRGSGEIEFQADAAYVLRDMSGGAEGDRVTQLDCVKNRHGPTKTLELVFRVEHMRFEQDGPNPDGDLSNWNSESF